MYYLILFNLIAIIYEFITYIPEKNSYLCLIGFLLNFNSFIGCFVYLEKYAEIKYSLLNKRNWTEISEKEKSNYIDFIKKNERRAYFILAIILFYGYGVIKGFFDVP